MEITIVSPGVPYPKAGRCIYCGKTEGEDFTEEHIIPSGLGGNHTLDEASCVDCQRRINTFETYCQRQMLGALRLRLGLGNTVPKGTFPLHIIGDDGKVQIVQVDPKDYPRMLQLGRWPDPGILIGREPAADFQWRPWLGVRADDRDAMRTTFGGRGYASPELHPVMLCRLLAKIGLAAAAAILRPQRYVPLVQGLIREGSDMPFHLVGGGFRDDEVPPQELGVAHWVSLNWEGQYLIASIRLFAFLGTPIYRVAVAKSRDNELAPIQYPPNTRHIEVLFELREGTPFPEVP